MKLNKKMATMMTDEQLLRVKTYCEEVLSKYKGTEYSDVDEHELFKLWQDSEDRLNALQAEHKHDSAQEAWWTEIEWCDELAVNSTIMNELHYRECKEGVRMVCEVMKCREENRLYGM